MTFPDTHSQQLGIRNQVAKHPIPDLVVFTLPVPVLYRLLDLLGADGPNSWRAHFFRIDPSSGHFLFSKRRRKPRAAQGSAICSTFATGRSPSRLKSQPQLAQTARLEELRLVAPQMTIDQIDSLCYCEGRPAPDRAPGLKVGGWRSRWQEVGWPHGAAKSESARDPWFVRLHTMDLS